VIEDTEPPRPELCSIATWLISFDCTVCLVSTDVPAKRKRRVMRLHPSDQTNKRIVDDSSVDSPPGIDQPCCYRFKEDTLSVALSILTNM